jgi:hypothetical protein
MHLSSCHSVKYPVFVLLWTYCTGSSINDVALIGTESTLCDLWPGLHVGIMQHSSELSQLTRCERRHALCGWTARKSHCVVPNISFHLSRGVNYKRTQKLGGDYQQLRFYTSSWITIKCNTDLVCRSLGLPQCRGRVRSWLISSSFVCRTQ